MRKYPDLTLMHQIMCNRYYEISRDDPYSYERDKILDDIRKIEELAEKYFDAYMEDYEFVSK